MPKKQPEQKTQDSAAADVPERAARIGGKIAAKVVRAKGSVRLKWTRQDSETLLSDVPEGERCAARVRRLSRNADGTHSYACYRNGNAVGIARDSRAGRDDGWDAAKARCESGDVTDMSAVLHYVSEHPHELPPFLALTEEERRVTRVDYPHAAPSVAVMAAIERGAPKRDPRGGPDMSDPSTVAFIASLEKAHAAGGAAAPGRAARTGAVPKPAREALAGVMRRAKDGNPKKPGTGAHKRWETMFAACGGTVAAYEAAGHNMETLANGVAKGYIKLEAEK